MAHDLRSEFVVRKDQNTITINREFAAHRQLVWDCHTKSELLDRWSEFWYAKVSAAFVSAWRETALGSSLKPGLVPHDEKCDRLLEILQIETALTAIDRASTTEPGPRMTPELRMVLNPAVAVTLE